MALGLGVLSAALAAGIAVADATVIPLGGGTEVVRFTNGDTPVDSGFSFTAILSH